MVEINALPECMWENTHIHWSETIIWELRGHNRPRIDSNKVEKYPMRHDSHFRQKRKSAANKQEPEELLPHIGRNRSCREHPNMIWHLTVVIQTMTISIWSGILCTVESHKICSDRTWVRRKGTPLCVPSFYSLPHSALRVWSYNATATKQRKARQTSGSRLVGQQPTLRKTSWQRYRTAFAVFDGCCLELPSNFRR